MSNEAKLSNIDLNVDEKKDEDKVDPWNVTAASETGIDYNKLICKFWDSLLLLLMIQCLTLSLLYLCS